MSVHDLFKNENDNYFHSSEYAKLARGNQLGTTNTRSFAERHRTDRARKLINRYHDSHVARHGSRNAGDVRAAQGRFTETPSRPQGA